MPRERNAPDGSPPRAVVMDRPVVCTPSISSCFIIIISVCLNNVFMCSYQVLFRKDALNDQKCYTDIM